MLDGLTYETLTRTLVDAVPELGDRFETLRREWVGETPGPHVVYGDLLNPYLLQLLASPDATTEEVASLHRIFAFLERLARDDDPRIQEVVSTTVIERLGSDRALLNIGRRYMGEFTRLLSNDTERFWNGEAHPRTVDHSVAPVGAVRPRGDETRSG